MNAIIRELATEDPADPWGDTQAVRFAIADILYASGEDIPAEWEYRPGLSVQDATLVSLSTCDDYPTNMLAESVVDGEVTADELRHAGNVLDRYAQLLDRAGRSY